MLMDHLRRTTPEMGGGAPPPPLAMDPNGIVPVNRAHPVANDGGEVQRLMERRLGTMPPVNFLAGNAKQVVPAEGQANVGRGPLSGPQMAVLQATAQRRGIVGLFARRMLQRLS